MVNNSLPLSSTHDGYRWKDWAEEEDEKGNKRVIAVRGEQEVIGEMTLLEGGTRCANILALEDCEVSVLSFRSFKDIPDTNPGVIALRKIMEARKKSEASLTPPISQPVQS